MKISGRCTSRSLIRDEKERTIIYRTDTKGGLEDTTTESILEVDVS